MIKSFLVVGNLPEQGKIYIRIFQLFLHIRFYLGNSGSFKQSWLYNDINEYVFCANAVLTFITSHLSRMKEQQSVELKHLAYENLKSTY